MSKPTRRRTCTLYGVSPGGDGFAQLKLTGPVGSIIEPLAVFGSKSQAMATSEILNRVKPMMPPWAAFEFTGVQER